MNKSIYIVNGPNFSHLHLREKEFYNQISLKDIETSIKKYSETLNNLNNIKFQLFFYQSNSEGEIISLLLDNIDKYDALIINPAALTHYSIAISDTFKILRLQNKIVCEVHISNIFAREEERRNSVTAKNADILITGAGIFSYNLALEYIREKLFI